MSNATIVAQVYCNALYYYSKHRPNRSAEQEAQHLAEKVRIALTQGIGVSLLSDVGVTIHWDTMESETVMWG